VSTSSSDIPGSAGGRLAFIPYIPELSRGFDVPGPLIRKHLSAKVFILG
jgi:hypothetical protein